jgi:5-methylcytosine-specific restriction endonuclease McrA
VPIRTENRARYPKDWAAISRSIRHHRARWVCEGIPGGERCFAVHGEPHPITRSKVVLTVAHLDHQPENCEPANLRALCQRCHNAYDAPMRRQGVKARARAALSTPDMLVEKAARDE